MSITIVELLTPLVRHHGDVATDIVGIVVVVQSRYGTVCTTLALLSVLVLSIVLKSPSVEHTATTC